MGENGQANDREGILRRYAGGLRCRPVAGAPADPGPEEWRFDILRAADGVVVTEVTGEIDLRTGAILRKRLFELGDAGFARIVIDFENVRFCDAAGLGVLVAAQNRLRERDGALALARVRPAQRRLFRVAGLDKRFTLYDSVQDAARAQDDAAPAPGGPTNRPNARPTTQPTTTPLA
ncbi:MAG TPA: STAS domain-containing protein [Streptosporangiaceae bacterium]